LEGWAVSLRANAELQSLEVVLQVDAIKRRLTLVEEEEAELPLEFEVRYEPTP